MPAHSPPVPPDQRSDNGSGAAADQNQTHSKDGFKTTDHNLAEQGRQGDSKRNTTHKGHQQDR